MELILNINQYDYYNYLTSNVSTLQIGLTNFCVGYIKSYDLDELENIVDNIHGNNKKIYLAINKIASESLINQLSTILPKLSSLNIDGFVVADFGILQMFKQYNLINKIIFNPVTNITNNFSSQILNNMGINHVCVANELNIKDILDIASYTNGNIEILAHGYYQICNSKRPLLTNFFKKHKIKDESNYYYIKEESRNYSYPIIELDGDCLVYIDKPRTILKYLKDIKDTNIQYLRIDTMFLSKSEIELTLSSYNKACENPSAIEEIIENMKQRTNSNFSCLDTISVLTKEKKNEH